MVVEASHPTAVPGQRLTGGDPYGHVRCILEFGHGTPVLVVGLAQADPPIFDGPTEICRAAPFALGT